MIQRNTIRKKQIPDGESLTSLQAIYPEIKSRRGLLNKWYMLRAITYMKDQPTFSWLIDDATFQETLLQELGRIDDPGTMMQVAAEVCLAKPKTVAGRRMIRGHRVHRPKADFIVLLQRLVDATTAYMETVSDPSDEVVVQAANWLAAMAKEKPDA